MIGRPADHSSRLARGELADAEAAERLAASAPDELLRRREFLGRTAALAGAAGMAGVLPAETLVAEAAKRSARKPLPRPGDLPIDTFVVLMMENRSFDHYFGWHPKADARNEGLSYPNLDGSQTFPTRRLTPDFQGCDFRDPDHGWVGGRHQYNRGRMDGFFTGNPDGDGSDEFALGYYLKEDLGFIPHVADAFQLYDRYFCSILASTYPNRHYQLSAQNGGQKSNILPIVDEPGLGAEWETILDRALAAGIGVAYYVSDLPVPALYGQRGLRWVRPASQFYLDAAAGTLPPVCFVDPPFRDGGGGNGVSADEHPHGDVRLGQAFMSDVAHAFLESPQYRRGAMFINYDEWGGFFDHVKPRRVPDDRANRKDLENDWSITGFRVPAVAISPYARAGAQGRARQPHDLHPRVDPEADLLPLPARPPEQAPPLREQHRAQLRLLQARLRAPRASRSRGDRGDPVRARRRRRAPEGARPGQARDLGPARAPRLRGPQGHLRLAVSLPRPGPQGVRADAMTLPPGPTAPPLVQTARWLWRPIDFLDACRRRHGDSFSVRFLGFQTPMVMISEPDAIRALYTSRENGLPPGRSFALEPIMGPRSVLLLEGSEHLSRRKAMLPPFHGDRMRAYDGRDRRGRRPPRSRAGRSGEPFAIHPRMQALTLEVILRAVFGVTDAGAASGCGRCSAAMLEQMASPRLQMRMLAARRLGRDGPLEELRAESAAGSTS